MGVCSLQIIILKKKKNKSFSWTSDYGVVTNWQAEREKEGLAKQQPQVRNFHKILGRWVVTDPSSGVSLQPKNNIIVSN
jgi:hypothetical protein